MKWAFVDYENVGSLGKIDLSSYARVIVFLGAKQPKLDFTYTKYDRSINLLLLQLKGIQANNLDCSPRQLSWQDSNSRFT